MSPRLGALQTHTTDTFLFISHTTNVGFIGVRIIKEMPGSVASGTYCIMGTCNRSATRKHWRLVIILCAMYIADKLRSQ